MQNVCLTLVFQCDTHKLVSNLNLRKYSSGIRFLLSITKYLFCMTIANSLILGFVLMLMTSFLMGTIARRKDNSLKSFFFGDKNLNTNHLVNLLLSTAFSMNGMIYQTWLGYSIGWAAVLIQVIWCISYLLLSGKALKIKEMTNHFGTLHGSIASQFGLNAGRIASIATVIGFTMLVGWELIVGTSLFSSIAPNNNQLKYILVFSLAGIGGIYTIYGGLKGNLKANIFQNWFGGLVMILIVTYFSLINFENKSIIKWGNINDLFINIGIVGFIANGVFSLGWQFVDMTNWQALASSDANESPKKALWWSALWILFIPGVVGTALGMLLRNIPNLTPDNIFLYIISVISHNRIALSIVSAGFVAAMLSTIDGLMLACGQVVTWDILYHSKVLKLISLKSEEVTYETFKEEKNIISVTRYWIFGLGIIGSFIFCWITIKYGINIFDLVYIVTGAQMVLLPIVLSILFGEKGNKKFGFISIFTGLIAVFFLDYIGVTMHNVKFDFPYISTGADVLPWSPLVALLISALWSLGFNAKKKVI